MDARRVLDQLEDLAETLGVEVVYERLAEEDLRPKGGLCRVRGQPKVFVDQSESIERRIEILARALSSFNTEDIFLLPQIREILDKARRS
jgi:hypothetical protein